MSYFSKGIKYLEGGIASGLTKSNSRLDKSPKLFKIKGRKNPIATQMASVSWSEMNQGDVFVVDLFDVIVVWNGSKANKMEKITGTRVMACRIRNFVQMTKS